LHTNVVNQFLKCFFTTLCRN